MEDLIKLLEEMGAKDARYVNDGNAELIAFEFNGKEAQICSWIGSSKDAGMESQVIVCGRTTLSISTTQPSTLDQDGYEALNYTEI